MSTDIQIIQPPKPQNRLYHLIGLGMLALNSWRHRIQGYKTPRPWFSRDASRILDYDRAVYNNWRRHLEDYLQFELELQDRNVVELLSLIHISEPTRPNASSRMPSSA